MVQRLIFIICSAEWFTLLIGCLAKHVQAQTVEVEQLTFRFAWANDATRYDAASASWLCVKSVAIAEYHTLGANLNCVSLLRDCGSFVRGFLAAVHVCSNSKVASVHFCEKCVPASMS